MTVSPSSVAECPSGSFGRLEAPRQPAAPEQPHEKPSEAAAVPQQQTAAGEPATRCSVAVCNIDQFPKEDRGKIVRHAAGIGPDDGTERDWASEQQDELLAPGDTEEATHKLVVMVGSSPFRYAVARHWCAHHNASVCSPIWEPVRQSMDEQAFLGVQLVYDWHGLASRVLSANRRECVGAVWLWACGVSLFGVST